MGPKNLKIMTWNAQSLKNKKLELYDYLTSHCIDIALINETHLTNKISISHRSFKIYRLDRDDTRRGGGVAIIIRRNIDHELIPCPLTKVIEAISIRVYQGNRSFIVSAVLLPWIN